MSFDENLTARIIETRTERAFAAVPMPGRREPPGLVDITQRAYAAGRATYRGTTSSGWDAIKPLIEGAPQRFGIARQSPEAAQPAVRGLASGPGTTCGTPRQRRPGPP